MSSANVGGLPGLEHSNPVFLLSRLLLEHKMVAVSKTRSSQAAVLGAKSWMWVRVCMGTLRLMSQQASTQKPIGQRFGAFCGIAQGPAAGLAGCYGCFVSTAE